MSLVEKHCDSNYDPFALPSTVTKIYKYEVNGIINLCSISKLVLLQKSLALTLCQSSLGKLHFLTEENEGSPFFQESAKAPGTQIATISASLFTSGCDIASNSHFSLCSGDVRFYSPSSITWSVRDHFLVSTSLLFAHVILEYMLEALKETKG